MEKQNWSWQWPSKSLEFEWGLRGLITNVLSMLNTSRSCRLAAPSKVHHFLESCKEPAHWKLLRYKFPSSSALSCPWARQHKVGANWGARGCKRGTKRVQEGLKTFYQWIQGLPLVTLSCDCRCVEIYQVSLSLCQKIVSSRVQNKEKDHTLSSSG